MMNISILIYSSSLVFLTFGTIFPIIFLIIICIHIRPLKSNVLLVLISNTYLALVFSSITLIEASLTSLLGNLFSSSLPGTSLCQLRTYLLHVGLCSVTYSIVLQAFFRLFRVVFFRKKVLRSFRLFSIAIIFQWILIFLINLPYIFLNEIQYISSEYRCAVPFTSNRAVAMVVILTYMIPINVIFSIYFYIIRYIRRTTNAMQNRQNSNKRDVIVFKRIIYLFIVLQIFSMPLCIIWIIHMINGYITAWNYYIEALISSISQICVSIVLASTTSQIREKFKWRRRRIHPNVEIRVRRRNTEELVQQNLGERF